jgi:hypothetical protein
MMLLVGCSASPAGQTEHVVLAHGTLFLSKGSNYLNFSAEIYMRIMFPVPTAAQLVSLKERVMKNAVVCVLSVLLFGFAAWAAGNPVVGTWDCVSNAGSGQDLTWTLVVKEDGGKLTGSLIGGPESPGEIPLVDPKLQEDIFTFKIDVNPNCKVEAKLKLEGKKLDGTFGCAEAAGTFKGKKRS